MYTPTPKRYVIAWRSLLTDVSGRGTASYERSQDLESSIERLNQDFSGILTHWLEEV